MAANVLSLMSEQFMERARFYLWCYNCIIKFIFFFKADMFFKFKGIQAVRIDFFLFILKVANIRCFILIINLHNFSSFIFSEVHIIYLNFNIFGLWVRYLLISWVRFSVKKITFHNIVEFVTNRSAIAF
jgi:hypothetical protein